MTGAPRPGGYLTEPRSWPVVLGAWLLAFAVLLRGIATNQPGLTTIGWVLLAAVALATIARALVVVTNEARARGVSATAAVRSYARSLIAWLLP